MVHGRRGLVEACYSSFSCLGSLDNAMECVVHGCDVLNKRGFPLPFRAIGAHPSNFRFHSLLLQLIFSGTPLFKGLPVRQAIYNR